MASGNGHGECGSAALGSWFAMMILRHLWASRRLGRFVDRELEPGLAARVSEHIDECERCAVEVTSLIGLKATLADLAGRRADSTTVARLTVWARDELPAHAA